MMSTQMKPTLKEFLQVQHIIETGAECPDELKAVYEGIFDKMFGRSKTAVGTKKTLTPQERAEQQRKDALFKQQASRSQGSYGTTKPGFQNSKIDLSPEERAAIMGKPKNLAVLHQGARTSSGTLPTARGRTIVGNRDHLNSLYNPKAGDKLKHIGDEED